MGRTKSYTEKHPALVQQVTQIAALEDKKSLEEIPGWDDFSILKKSILMVIPFCSDALEAYRFVMKDPRAKHNTLRMLRTRDPEFDAAIRFRLMKHVDIAAKLGTELWGLSMFRLQQYLHDDDVPDRVRLRAIELLLKINGIDKGDTTAPVHGMVNYGEVNIVNAEGIKPRFAETVVET